MCRSASRQRLKTLSPSIFGKPEIENDKVIGFRVAAEPRVLSSCRRDFSKISSRPSAPLEMSAS